MSVCLCVCVCLSVCLCSVSRWTGAAAAAAALCVGAADLASPRASAIDATLCAAAAANPPPTANPPQAGAVQTAATNRRRNGPTTTTTTTRHTGQTGRELYLKDALRPRTLSLPILGVRWTFDISDHKCCICPAKCTKMQNIWSEQSIPGPR